MRFRSTSISTLTSTCRIAALLLLAACSGPKKSTEDYFYFRYGPNQVTAQQQETIIRPNDPLSIHVYSKTSNQEQTYIFNFPPVGGPGLSTGGLTGGGTTSAGAAGSSGSVIGYQVSTAGTIEFPKLGTIQVAGLTKNQLQALLTEKVTTYVKEPTVIVKLLQFNINVLGEVKNPGTKNFAMDRVTIIDALGAAGDLTDAARRDDITIIREEQGKKVFHAVDLRSRALFESPLFVLQPNDIVYVKPNEYKLKSLNVDPDVQRKTGLFTTALSIVITLATLIVTVLR